MKALLFDGTLRLDKNYPSPALKPGWAIIRVKQAGICRTDLEIIKGYMNYRGVLGHEFIGVVTECDDPNWLGRRVVGEINAACGQCDFCRRGFARHCPNRSVLGILNLDGCMAEYCTLPISNLHVVPDSIRDDRAVFIEPLSAAFEILEQLYISETERCVVLGDGKIGILCAWTLATVAENVTLVGHHAEKLKAALWKNIHTARSIGDIPPGADIVVEATGSADGLKEALSLCRPRGKIVLKSTFAEKPTLDLAPIVIQELTLVGSRCGDFKTGLKALTAFDFPLDRLIAGAYGLDKAETAFAQAANNEALKVLITMD